MTRRPHLRLVLPDPPVWTLRPAAGEYEPMRAARLHAVALPSEAMRRQRAVLANVAMALGIVGFCLASWAAAISGLGRLGGDEPTAETFVRPTVPYTAPTEPQLPPAPIELKPYVAPVPAGLPPTCPADGCASYLVPRF